MKLTPTFDYASTTSMSQQIHVLVAEDSDADFLCLSIAFGKAGLSHKLHRVPDGEVALAYLQGSPPFSDRQFWPLPQLLILDIKMPRASGFDVLAALRSHPDLSIPIIILSGSDLAEDRRMALSLGAADYFTKPADISALIDLAHHIDDRWLRPKTFEDQPREPEHHDPLRPMGPEP